MVAVARPAIHRVISLVGLLGQFENDHESEKVANVVNVTTGVSAFSRLGFTFSPTCGRREAPEYKVEEQ